MKTLAYESLGESEECSEFMIVAVQMKNDLAKVPDANPLVVATIDIVPAATMLNAMELSVRFAQAALEHQVRVVGRGFGRAFSDASFPGLS